MISASVEGILRIRLVSSEEFTWSVTENTYKCLCDILSDLTNNDFINVSNAEDGSHCLLPIKYIVSIVWRNK